MMTSLTLTHIGIRWIVPSSLGF
uniref:Uncharacterized protein n=1 Tax=Arundo donax TaxID=35708 RepID=A0A0A8ZWT2_ARUDO